MNEYILINLFISNFNIQILAPPFCISECMSLKNQCNWVGITVSLYLYLNILCLVHITTDSVITDGEIIMGIYN